MAVVLVCKSTMYENSKGRAKEENTKERKKTCSREETSKEFYFEGFTHHSPSSTLGLVGLFLFARKVLQQVSEICGFKIDE